MINQEKEGKVHVSNLPNSIPQKHIVDYLETAGAIKECDFQVSGQRLSAVVVYHDYESAQMAKKYLDQKQFNTRKIKITLDQVQMREVKSDNNSGLKNKIGNLKKDQRIKLFRYLKGLRDQQGQMFVDFLDANPWLSEELAKY